MEIILAKIVTILLLAGAFALICAGLFPQETEAVAVKREAASAFCFGAYFLRDHNCPDNVEMG